MVEEKILKIRKCRFIGLLPTINNTSTGDEEGLNAPSEGNSVQSLPMV